MFSIAAAFGNVHGVYKVEKKFTFLLATSWSLSLSQSGNVVLSPHLLKGHQQFAKEQLKCSEEKPLYLVMHGGSGSSEAEIREAVRRQRSYLGKSNYFSLSGSKRRGEDERWHGHPMGVLGRTEGILQEEWGLPTRPGLSLCQIPSLWEYIVFTHICLDWQPRRRWQAEQEVLRPASLDPSRRGVDDQESSRELQVPQWCQRLWRRLA